MGISLIVLAAAFSAGTAVFNRALKTVDYAVVMTYHGLFGFVVTLAILTINYFILSSETAESSLLQLDGFECIMLVFGVLVDAASVFG